MLPKDPYSLLCFVYLEDLCASLDVDETSLRETLAGLDYHYDPVYHQFV